MQIAVDTLRAYAPWVAFVALWCAGTIFNALSRLPEDRWKALERESPRLHAAFRIARALFGDMATASRAAADFFSARAEKQRPVLRIYDASPPPMVSDIPPPPDTIPETPDTKRDP